MVSPPRLCYLSCNCSINIVFPYLPANKAEVWFCGICENLKLNWSHITDKTRDLFNCGTIFILLTLQRSHNGHDGVSNHQLTIVYSSVYSGADQRKHQSSASLAFVRGIPRGPVNSPHKGPVTRQICFHLVMSSCNCDLDISTHTPAFLTCIPLCACAINNNPVLVRIMTLR